MEAEAGQQEQTGGEAGTLAHLLTHSVSHCQFMFQTLQQLVRMVLYLGCKGQRAVKHVFILLHTFAYFHNPLAQVYWPQFPAKPAAAN